METQTIIQENHRLKILHNTAAGLLWRLEQGGYIQTTDQAAEAELQYWREIGRGVVKQATQLLNPANRTPID